MMKILWGMYSERLGSVEQCWREWRECEHEMDQTLGKHVGEDVRVLGLLRTGTL